MIDHPSLPERITGKLSSSLTKIRLNPVYVRRQRRLEQFLRDLPYVGPQAEKSVEAFKAAVREFLQPPSFFEALGVRYVGPVDGHDIELLEHTFENAIELSAEGPIVVHVVTQKGRGYPPAEDDDEKHLHDAPIFDPIVGPPPAVVTGYTQAFAEAIIKEAEADPRVVAITAAMPGPTGLLPFQARFPDRFFDVGIAEQHAVTGAAGMAMAGLRPIVAIYSTFLNRAWDQVVYDVAMHRLPVVFCLDRAGITGPDGASHHGVYDMALAGTSARHARARAVERRGAAVDAARRDRPRRRRTGRHSLATRRGPSCWRTRGRRRSARAQGARGRRIGVHHRHRQDGDRRDQGRRSCSRPAECRRRCGMRGRARRSIPTMIADAARHRVVVTAEDGVRDGRHRHDDRRSGPRDRPPAFPCACSGLPSKFIPQGTADRILASSASTPTASLPPLARALVA